MIKMYGYFLISYLQIIKHSHFIVQNISNKSFFLMFAHQFVFFVKFCPIVKRATKINLMWNNWNIKKLYISISKIIRPVVEYHLECGKEIELTEDVLWVFCVIVLHRKMIDPVAAPIVDPCAKYKWWWTL